MVIALKADEDIEIVGKAGIAVKADGDAANDEISNLASVECRQ